MPAAKRLFERMFHLLDPIYLREWAQSYENPSAWRPFLLRQLEVFVHTARSIHREEITLRAAALTYQTVFSLVPLLAVGFALFKAFGGLRKLEQPLRQFVVDNLAVGRAEEVGRWLDQFIANVSAGAIAGVGVILLFYSAVGLLTNIESSINKIWGIRRGRPLFQRFAIYWCLVTLAPPLLGLSISLTARLQSSIFASTVVAWLPFGIGRWLLASVSALAVCAAFMFTYLIVPATKVRFKAALLGGVVAGLLWNLSKLIFIKLSAGTIKYSAVYGALGALPLLMLWIYVSWVIVLFGATFTCANHSVARGSLDPTTTQLSMVTRERLAFRVLGAVADAFRRGRTPPTAEEVAVEVEASVSLVAPLLSTLVRLKLILEVDGDRPEEGYVPARDPEEMSLAEAWKTLRHQDGNNLRFGDDALWRRVRGTLEEAEQGMDAVLRPMSLRSFVLDLGSEDGTTSTAGGPRCGGSATPVPVREGG